MGDGRTGEASNSLRVVRTRAGLTQSQLAELAGVSPSYISGLETGARRGSLDVWHLVARVLSVDMASLLGIASERTPVVKGKMLAGLQQEGADLPAPLLVRELPVPYAGKGEHKRHPVLAHQWAKDRFVVRCLDEAMFPTLRTGDMVLVSPGSSRNGGKICLVAYRRKIIIRRVSNRGGRTTLAADNPAFPATRVAVGDDFKVLGVCVEIASRKLV